MSLLYCCSAFLASSRIGLDKDVVLNVRTRSTSGNPDCGDSESGIGGDDKTAQTNGRFRHDITNTKYL